jgi:iron complex transport system permease protein
MTTAQIWQALIKTGDPLNQTIIWDLRLPRILAAVLVGAALGMSGSLLQGMLRNGLADPFLLGISAGAGLFAITMFSLGIFLSWIPLAAWVGGLLTTIVVYFLARSREGISIERLILGGVAVSSLFGAIQSVLLLMAEDGRIQTALSWLIGSLNGRGWNEVTVAGAYISVALLLGCLLARAVNLLNLGDELAVQFRSKLIARSHFNRCCSHTSSRRCCQCWWINRLCRFNCTSRHPPSRRYRLPCSFAIKRCWGCFSSHRS